DNLSTNGRLFFNSYDALSVNDRNGRFEDVYEYEPDGLGSCGMAGGCVSLISSGNEDTNSRFVNATPSGSDVFFTTRSELVPEDQDDLIDLYDARIDGGGNHRSQMVECTTSETCKGSPSLPPNLEMPLSTGISGSGNLPLASPPSPPAPPPSPTRAQLLAKALKTCRRQKAKKKRVACETHARKLYGPKTKPKASKTSKQRK